MKDFEINIAHHTFQRGSLDMSKTGKNHGSIVAHNLCPLSDIFKYISPVMHVIMGLTNDTIKEVKSDVVKKDQAERKDKHIMNTSWTDNNGKIIVEPLKQIIISENI